MRSLIQITHEIKQVMSCKKIDFLSVIYKLQTFSQHIKLQKYVIFI
jgi:hypothetical protein